MSRRDLAEEASKDDRGRVGRVVYLDANATERLRPEARAAAAASFDVDANPASVHAPGRQANRLLEVARTRVAAAFRVDDDDVIFTSGGTEANALALHGLRPGRVVMIGATEHDGIRAAAGPDARVLPVARDGTIAPETLANALAAQGQPALVVLMAANNETGVLHAIDACGRLCAEAGALLHVDAVQAAGRLDAIPVPGRDGVASVAVSGHKMGGLAGAGALLLAPGLRLGPALIGGAQELGRRGGTPSLAAINAFAAVADLRLPERIEALRDLIEQAAVDAGAVVCGAGARRLPNTTALALPGRSSATQLITLDLAGFAVSAGAACSSGKLGPSHVLAAMGLGRLAAEAIRVSLSWSTTEADALSFARAYRDMAARRQAPGPP